MKGKNKLNNIIKKNKSKKIFVVAAILAGVIALGGCFAGGMVVGNNMAKEQLKKDENKGDLVVTADANIKITNVKKAINASGEQVEEITYSMKPAGATTKDFNIEFDWNRGTSSDYDWDYDSTRKVEDYVTYDLDTDNQKVTFTCKKAFGRKINFTMRLALNPEVAAGMFLDYERKEVTPASASIPNAKFSEGKPVQVNTASATYSIGTTGRRQDDIAVTAEYDASKVAFNTLFGTAKNPSTYSGSYYYGDQNTTSSATLISWMSPKVDAYLKSVITTDGSVNFEASKLSELITFQYIQYHTYMDVKGNDSHVVNDFITNYKAAVTKGSGYRVKVTVNGEEKLNQLIDFELTANLITNVGFSRSTIVF
jgi:hypothetical protein